MSTRRTSGNDVQAVLAGLDDADLLALLAGGEPLATGIGGTTARVRVEGTDVFVKQMPLSELEAGNLTSTANLFDLPAVCHYGIGSPGFGVARELAVHELTTRWMQEEATDNFPIMYHWRTVDRPCGVDLSEFDGPTAVRRWGRHWASVRRRVNALRTADASIAVFLEYEPHTLKSWLRERFAAGSPNGAAALGDAVGQITASAGWTKEHGLLHLDLHPGNVLFRHGRLLLTDFGLSMHRDFDLDPDERSFFGDHDHYDRESGITSLLHWVLAELELGSSAQRLEILGAAADGRTARLDPVRDRLGQSAVDLIAEHAEMAMAFTERFEILSTNASVR